ncbi:hypothetical protein J1785_03010 [Rahnella sp. SL6]|uniref:hypothetical protein n=1 Tax=Rahnella perminowiae TaxID=2816244 RepID=UPI001C25CE20|nr:hypothetical protein [Rahnella perminowiae]MBU9808723.1 hypothetical protein [Rahnella perminowiae]
MSFMSVSQYAKHAGMSRQALYTWEAKQGFPARVGGKIDQAACDTYLRQFRDSHDPRMKNATGKTTSAKSQPIAGKELVEISVADIKRRLAQCTGRAADMDEDERAALAAKAVGLYLSEGPNNPPMTFGGYRLAMNDCPQWEPEIVAGGAFGLSAVDVVGHCREYVLYVVEDESDTYPVIPALLYALGNDE